MNLHICVKQLTEDARYETALRGRIAVVQNAFREKHILLSIRNIQLELRNTVT